MSKYEIFPRERLQLKPLAQRNNILNIVDRISPGANTKFEHPDFPVLVESIRRARQADRPVIWMVGAHTIKQGLSEIIVRLMEQGWITHFATNGAGIIHDYELALQGGTSEDVARYIRNGEFGMWQDTATLNDIIRSGAALGEGLGEAVGRFIHENDFPQKALSVAATGFRLNIPVTSHVGIGSDIIHQHPNCDGAALGATSYTDFLIFARSVQELEGGVFLNFGSAVTGPEVYLKALSMVRNLARQEGQEVKDFTTAVFDLVQLPEDFREGTAPKTHPQYYYRPWKTILVRTVADGGKSYYFCGDHLQTIPSLFDRLQKQ